jgi:hypothetical protein
MFKIIRIKEPSVPVISKAAKSQQLSYRNPR